MIDIHRQAMLGGDDSLVFGVLVKMDNGHDNRIADCVFALLAIFSDSRSRAVLPASSPSRQSFKYESTQYHEAALCFNPVSEDVCIVPTLFRFLLRSLPLVPQLALGLVGPC